MKVKDVRLHLVIDYKHRGVELFDQEGNTTCKVYWRLGLRTKPQAIAIAKRLCDRFNKGQEGK